MFKFRTLVMVALAIAAIMISCTDSDDDSSLISPPVLFSITVHDADGSPVQGLRVGSINHGSSAKAASAKPCPDTPINFSVPEATDYELTIFNYHNDTVRIFSGHAEAGEHTIMWNGTDDNGDYIPGGFYRMRLVAGSFDAQRWFVYDWGSDPYHTILGTLDADGAFATNDTALFPGLVSNPPIEYYTDTVTIHLSHPDFPNDFFMKTMVLSPAGNSLSFIYDSLGLPSAKAD